MSAKYNHDQKLGFFRWDFLSQRKSQLRGDTLVEIMFAVGVFGLVAIGAIGIMNKGLYDAQKALEITMARQEIDAQAEGLRFLHEAYQAEKNNQDLSQTPYTHIWEWLVRRAYKPSDAKLAHLSDSYNGVECSKIYSEHKAIPSPESSLYGAKPFILNLRRLDETVAASYMQISGSTTSVATTNGTGIIINYDTATNMFEQSPTYPRLLYSNIYSSTSEVHDLDTTLTDQDIDELSGRKISTYYTSMTKAQGIWIVSIASSDTNPEFYDFHIRTCWNSPGDNDSTTISTVVRLFNPNHH
ncbi:hypothetical protein IKF74_00235 [Candidatus Saccharibacteria bacterium]|nr:hypothetical protein [Candidatus Saccharibacteria bacterium]